MSTQWTNRARRAPRGFTLLELLVVVGILATLAAMVIPKLDWAREKSGYAAAAATAGELSNAIQTHKVATGLYPNGFDSLLTTTENEQISTLWAPASSYNVTAWDLTEDSYFGNSYLTSLIRSGIDTVFDHPDTAGSDPNATVATGRSLINFASPTAAGVGSLATTTRADVVRAAGFPSGALPTGGDGTGVMLVLFGVGERNGMIGKTLQSAPMDTAWESSEYSRFLAVFAVYENGKTAELKTVLDSHQVAATARLNSYRNTGPTSE